MVNNQILTKEQLDELKKINNFRATVDLIFRLAGELILLALLVNLVLSKNYTLAVVVFFIVSVWHSFWGYAGLSHELFHGRVFSNKKFTRIVLYFANALTWTNGFFFRKSHSLHHAKTFDKKDTEVSLQPWRVLSIIQYVFVDFQVAFKRVYFALLNSLGIFPGIVMTNSESRHAQLIAIWILLFNVAIQLILWFFFENLILNLLFFLIPFSGHIINRMLAQSQHLGLSKNKNKGPVYHSRTVIVPFILEFLYSGMNYHVEHHLYPMIPYYNLPKIHSILKANGVEFNSVDYKYFFKDFWYGL